MEAEAINVRFPFSVTNLEFRNKIEEILSLQANPLENRLKGLKPAARTLYDKGIELQNKLQDMVNNSEWEVKSNDLEYTSYTMKDNSHLLYIKSIAIVPATPIEVYTYLQLDQYTKEHDYYYLGGKTIEEYSVNIKTRHWTFSTGMFAARRDFVLLQHTQYNPDGSIHVAFGSIEDPRLPPTMIPVRGNVAVKFACTLGGRVCDSAEVGWEVRVGVRDSDEHVREFGGARKEECGEGAGEKSLLDQQSLCQAI
eukprot:TRINITY_DN79_c0_g2_i3.p1 TRINITY_DN79_c0_g2~~TRINITY_DN79_c0_g2_i3.p1  ORF type:complete len:253 (+),score=12.60 TRINITY_DN79_c0_g2_i3:119-877(+)